jgi:hypothetical protein
MKKLTLATLLATSVLATSIQAAEFNGAYIGAGITSTAAKC